MSEGESAWPFRVPTSLSGKDWLGWRTTNPVLNVTSARETKVWLHPGTMAPSGRPLAVSLDSCATRRLRAARTVLWTDDPDAVEFLAPSRLNSLQAFSCPTGIRPAAFSDRDYHIARLTPPIRRNQ